MATRARDLTTLLESYAERSKAMSDTSSGEHAASMPTMEIAFKDVSVISTAPTKARVPTVATFFSDAATKPCTNKTEVKLLDNVSGIVKPGRLTLLMGAPGSGKSTLLKALSSKLTGEGVKVQGDVYYNGTPSVGAHRQFVPQRTVGYVAQHDEHIASLTVRETLMMACACTNGDKGQHLVEVPTKPQTEQQQHQTVLGTSKVDLLLEVLGLTTCQDTPVGNDMQRGISGGQSRRLSLAEMLAGNFLALLLDEVTTGLDAATAFDVVKVMRSLTDVLQVSVVASLLQPSPEVFAQFDDVILLERGSIVYHGRSESILGYFKSLGFQRPPRQDVADYLQEVTSSEGIPKYLMDEADFDCIESAPPNNVSGFVGLWQATSQAQAMHCELAFVVQQADQGKECPPALPELQHHFAQRFLNSTALCSKMFGLLLIRDAAALRSLVVGNVVVGCIVALLFYDLHIEEVQCKLALIFLTLTNLGLMGLSSMPVMVSLRNVFYKQRDANFYPTFAYGIAQSLSTLPITFINVMIFATSIYWTSGLATDAACTAHFTFFVGICCLLDMTMSQFFRLLIGVMPSYDSAVPVAAISILCMVVFSGFIFAPQDIPSYWIWLYYLNPFTHAYTALVHNELKSKSYSAVDPQTGSPVGDTYLEQFGFPAEDHWMSTSCLCLVAFYVTMLLFSNMSFHFIRHSKQPQPHARGQGGTRVTKSSSCARTLSNRSAHCLPEEVASRGSKNLPESFCDDASSPDILECSLSWRHLSYHVEVSQRGTGPNTKLQLLDDVSGYCLPGTLTALMGSSGAGKTTLLDVLAGRKTCGRTSGDIFANGHPLDRASFSRVSAYVEQTDIHLITETVAECFRFSARLRCRATVSDAEIQSIVMQTLSILELKGLAGTLLSRLSSEEMKRVTIGVELVANPSVLFMDEPTSRLDSRAAMNIANILRRLAAAGRTVICTIHQPSYAIFDSFDALHLLEHGGRTVYMGPLGPESSNLVCYLQAIPGVIPICAGVNPASWMLDVIGAGTLGDEVHTDFAAIYDSSKLKEQNEAKLCQVELDLSPHLDHQAVAAASGMIQLMQCAKRNFRSYWRNPGYNAARLMVSATVASLMASINWQSELDDFAAAYAIVAVIYLTTAFLGIVCTAMALPVAGQLRTVFYKENAAHLYSAKVHALATVIVEVPYLIASCMIFINIFYWCIGLRADVETYLYYFCILQLYMAQATFFGHFLVYVVPSQQVAQITAAMCSTIFSLLAGYVKPPQSIPDGFIPLHWANPLAFAFKGLLLTQFHNDDREIQVSTSSGNSMSLSMDSFIFQVRFTNLDYSDRHLTLAVLGGFVLTWCLGILIASRHVRYLKR